MKINFDKLALSIENESIDRIGTNCEEKSFKFVGHFLDEFLSWDCHINHVKNKLSKSNYAICSSKNCMPLPVRKLLYKNIFRPYLDFGIIAWAGVKKSQLLNLTNLQKNA